MFCIVLTHQLWLSKQALLKNIASAGFMHVWLANCDIPFIDVRPSMIPVAVTVMGNSTGKFVVVAWNYFRCVEYA